MDLEPLLSRFCTVGQSGIRLERPFPIPKVLLDPQEYHFCEDVPSIHLFVDLDRLFHEIQSCRACKFRPTLWQTDDFGGVRWWPRYWEPLQTSSSCFCGVCLFHSEQTLIGEEEPPPPQTCRPTNELTTLLRQYALVFIHQELRFLDPGGLESELLFCHSLHWSVAPASFTGDFRYGNPPILLNALLDDFRVPRTIAGVFFPLSGRLDSWPASLTFLTAFKTTSTNTEQTKKVT